MLQNHEYVQFLANLILKEVILTPKIGLSVPEFKKVIEMKIAGFHMRLGMRMMIHEFLNNHLTSEFF